MTAAIDLGWSLQQARLDLKGMLADMLNRTVAATEELGQVVANLTLAEGDPHDPSPTSLVLQSRSGHKPRGLVA